MIGQPMVVLTVRILRQSRDLERNGKARNQVFWKLDIGLGYSSVVEYKGKALTQGLKTEKYFFA